MSRDIEVGRILQSVGFISRAEYLECIEDKRLGAGPIDKQLLTKGLVTEGHLETAHRLLVRGDQV